MQTEYFNPRYNNAAASSIDDDPGQTWSDVMSKSDEKGKES